jgi:hypothetical protein
MNRRTKIVATLGPATDEPEVLERLITAGCDVVRVNFSHGDPDTHARRIRMVRAAARELDTDVAVLATWPGRRSASTDSAKVRVDAQAGQPFVLYARKNPPIGTIATASGVAYLGWSATSARQRAVAGRRLDGDAGRKSRRRRDPLCGHDRRLAVGSQGLEPARRRAVRSRDCRRPMRPISNVPPSGRWITWRSRFHAVPRISSRPGNDAQAGGHGRTGVQDRARRGDREPGIDHRCLRCRAGCARRPGRGNRRRRTAGPAKAHHLGLAGPEPGGDHGHPDDAVDGRVSRFRPVPRCSMWPMP